MNARFVSLIGIWFLVACTSPITKPPQVLQEARKRDRLLICEGCGRLLLLPPEDATV